MMKVTYNVPEETVKILQKLDADVRTMSGVINNFVNTHINDVDTSAIDSPVFKAYQEKASDALIAYDMEKDKMFQSTVPEDVRAKAAEWSLDFFTGILTVQVQ